MIEKIRIPEERKAVVIGKYGAVKRVIEKKLEVKIGMNDEVSIEGEAVNVMDAANVVRAIGRGFSPECALLLADEKYTLFIIQLPKNEHALVRMRSRIIGAGGKARRNIERLSNARVCVYGKTVSVIGEYEGADMARRAIEKLMKGFSHRTVYVFLEKERSELRKRDGGL